MSVAAGLSWSQDPSLINPSDTPSPIFPDRPIRPLPKRRLRSRLSAEEAGSIVYPPVPPSSSPIYGSPQSQSDRSFTIPRFSNDVKVLRNEHEHVCNCGADHSEAESEEGEEPRRVESPEEHRYSSWPDKMMRYPRHYLERVTNRAKSQTQLHPPNSAASSGDGYESFENTNNKKKRKIPIPGTVSSVMSYDGSVGVPSQSVDVSVPEELNSNELAHYGSVSSPYSGGSANGISTTGRNRFAKPSNRSFLERKPLVNASNAINMFMTGPNASDVPLSRATNTTSIASSDCVLAAGDQENASFLEKHLQQTPAKSKDFTFECKSDSSTKMNLTSQSVPHVQASTNTLQSNPAHAAVAQGTQTSTNAANTSQRANVPPQGPVKKKKPRIPGLSLLKAAQRRRGQQAYENQCNPPRKEDVWICEFCEYESIFGIQPAALVKQYEIKDKKERKRIEEKRRLLEKAKAKGRKNNKRSAKGNSKSGTAGAGSSLNQSASQRQDSQYDPNDDQDSQGEEYFEDGYDEHEHTEAGITPGQFEENHWNSVKGDVPSHYALDPGLPNQPRPQSLYRA